MTMGFFHVENLFIFMLHVFSVSMSIAIIPTANNSMYYATNGYYYRMFYYYRDMYGSWIF